MEGGSQKVGAQMRDGGFVASGKHGGYFCGAHLMVEGESDGRPGSAGGATADGIHDHQNGTAAGFQQAVHIIRGSGLFYTVAGKILAHCGDELFRVWHTPILPCLETL